MPDNFACFEISDLSMFIHIFPSLLIISVIYTLLVGVVGFSDSERRPCIALFRVVSQFREQHGLDYNTR